MAKVKICGITNLDDALAAIDAGADALGFNFFEQSPRHIAPDTAREIIRELPDGISKIGVFVNKGVDSVIDIASTVSLDAIQLHGDEPSDYVDDLIDRCSFEVIKAFRVADGFVAEETTGYKVEGILLDGFAVNARGGTGATFDWEVAKRVRALVSRLWLAGGLSPDNVRAAILDVKPYGVDACSSLESGPGVKDHEKLRNFITEAKAV